MYLATSRGATRETHQYSAAYNPAGSPVPPTPPDIECFPDAGSNTGNPIACPLYSDTTTLPPDSKVDCATVCDEYESCQNANGVLETLHW